MSSKPGPGHILIIDDEESLRKLLARIIRLEGYQVSEAATLAAASGFLEKNVVDIILCDVKLPDGNGVDYVKEIRAKYQLPEIILLTAYSNVHDGVQAVKNGAFDYLAKGDDNDRIIPLLAQAMEKVSKRKENAVQIKTTEGSFSAIIGESREIKQVLSLAKKIAPTDTTVLLLGETGTGKEVFANAIHAESKRSARSIIAINCSSFSKELLEGELFGHKAGAFTGAAKDKKGLIEIADGGTLFLDEIGEMNIDLQARLLRVLENGEFIKLGDIKTTKVNVRLIAATNRSLKTEVEDGRFREDLFYRLNTFTISLPALRERKDDVEALANYFLRYFAEKQNLSPLSFDVQAMKILKNYTWKGNIRELRNVVERAVILAEGDEISPQDFPSELQYESAPGVMNYTLAEVEKLHIQKILAHTAQNKTRAAQLMGIGIATLYRKLDEYGLNK